MEKIFSKIKNFIKEIADNINQIDVLDEEDRFKGLSKEQKKFVEQLDEMDNVEQIEKMYGGIREEFKAKYHTAVNVEQARKRAETKEIQHESTKKSDDRYINK